MASSSSHSQLPTHLPPTISAPSSELLNLLNLDSLYVGRRKGVLLTPGSTQGVSQVPIPGFYQGKRRQLLLMQHQLQVQKNQIKKGIHESPFYQIQRQRIFQKRLGFVNGAVVKSASASSFSINVAGGGIGSGSSIFSASVPKKLSLNTAGLKTISSVSSPSPSNSHSPSSVPSSPSGHHSLGPSPYSIFLSLRHHGQGITRIKFAQREIGRFAACSNDCNVSICTVEYNETMRMIESKGILLLRGHEASVSDLCWSNDNSFLVTTSCMDKSVRMWNTATGASIRVIKDRPIQCCELVVLNNNMVVGGSLDGQINIMNLSTGKSVANSRISGNMVKCLTLSEEGGVIFLGDEAGNLHVYSLNQMNMSLGKIVKLAVTSKSSPITGISYTPQFSRDKREPCLLVSGKDNHMRLYKVTDAVSHLAPPATSNSKSDGAIGGNGIKLALKQVIPIKNQQSDCIQPCFSLNPSKSNTCTFASGSEDSLVHIYDLSTFQISAGAIDQQHQKLSGHSCTVLSVAFNWDKSLIVSGDAQGTIRVWKK